MSIYNKLPEILIRNAHPTLETLEMRMAEKADYIKYCYSNDLTPAQFRRIKKDEELLKAITAHINTLEHQRRYLLHELEKGRQNEAKAILEAFEYKNDNQDLLLMAAKEKLAKFKQQAA